MYCPTCKTTYPQGAFCASDGTALVAEPGRGRIGQVLAERYRIVRLLGEGGMGQVYEAQHVNINKRFALKLLRPEVVGSPQSLARFRQEAWAASSIGHANIVEIDDFATLPSGEVYLAMELLDGQSLAERLRDGPELGLPEALHLLIAVGRGLAAAHDKGIVHRDMKPENIFLQRKSGGLIAKILDFGIAKVQGGDEPSTLTRTGAIFGTPLYMSPEQARGKPADARADVYALGVIVYEVATGRVPFGGGSSVEILSQQIAAPPVPPHEVAPEREIPPALEEVILRAMAKEPDERYATMAELVAALETVAATLPPPPKREPTPLPPPSRRVAQVTPGPVRAVGAASSRPPEGRAVGGTNPPVGSQSGPQAAAGAHPAQGGYAAPGTQPPVGAPARLPTPAAGTPALATTGSSTNPPAYEATLAPPARSHTARNAGIAAALVALAVALVLLLLPGRKPTLLTGPVAPPAPAPPSPSPAPAVPSPPGPPAPPPKELAVILDSTPPGAHIVRDGVVIGDTPDAVKITAATELVLKKEGFSDKPVTLDPSQHKLLVRLERSARPVAVKPAKIAGAAPPATTPSSKATKDVPLEPYGGARPVATAATPKPAPAVATVAATPRPARPAADALSARVDKQAAAIVPGGKRVGDVYKGSAPKSGGRSDWYAPLSAGRCYTFVGEGGDGVRGLYLYLWGPDGKRATEARVRSEHAQMRYCALVAGQYHFQAKISDGGGEYGVGIYQQK